MPIEIPRFCQNPTFKNELESLLEDFILSGELSAPRDSIPQIIEIISEVLLNVENRYAGLISLLNIKYENDNNELRKFIIKLKEDSVMNYEFSKN